MSNIDHNKIFQDITENNTEIDAEVLKQAYIDLCKMNMRNNDLYSKLKKEKKQLQKKFEEIVDLYVMDKSVLEFNNIHLIENEETENINNLCRRLKINGKFTKDKMIPKKVSKNIEKQIKDCYKQPNLKKKLFMFTLNNQGIIQTHMMFENNKDTYIKNQHIHPEHILFSTNITTELNDEIINKLYASKIINPVLEGVHIFREQQENTFKTNYINLFNELNLNDEFVINYV